MTFPDWLSSDLHPPSNLLACAPASTSLDLTQRTEPVSSTRPPFSLSTSLPGVQGSLWCRSATGAAPSTRKFANSSSCL